MTELSDSPRVLILDDDADVLEVLRQELQADNFEVVCFSDPAAALAQLRAQPFAVVLSDHFMPSMDGLEFLRQAADIQHSASRVLMTGFASVDVTVDAINSGLLFRFITKPWTDEDLRATLHNAVSRHRLIERNAELERKAHALNAQLAEANEALAANFEQSLELCHRIVATFSPLLARSTRAVEDICKQFCTSDLLSPSEQKVLRVSAALHNIGLLGVSREVLTKSFKARPKLSDEEQALIRNHPIYGQTLAGFVGNLAGVGECIRAHHERYDGSGYPDGLAEEAIPRPARFLAVAAAFVESGEDRDVAIQMIEDQSGKAFFPEAVRAFMKLSHLSTLPKQVREVTATELRAGMTLATGLHSPAGLLLVPEGRPLTRDLLRKLESHNVLDHVKDRLLVYV